MKSGRPAYHVRAKWISLLNAQGTLTFFELDKKGNIISPHSALSDIPVTDMATPQTQVVGKPAPVKRKTKVKSEVIIPNTTIAEIEDFSATSLFEFEDDISIDQLFDEGTTLLDDADPFDFQFGI